MNSITFRFGGNFEPRAGGMFVGARQHRDWDSGVFEAMTASRERGGETVKVGFFCARQHRDGDFRLFEAITASRERGGQKL